MVPFIAPHFSQKRVMQLRDNSSRINKKEKASPNKLKAR